ncbi:MAG: M15 family metallopeptidase [Acidimicrobiia bacterium]|nr:M15 family metallopeptidase [Acidimicrobiia bacterium]
MTRPAFLIVALLVLVTACSGTPEAVEDTAPTTTTHAAGAPVSTAPTSTTAAGPAPSATPPTAWLPDPTPPPGSGWSFNESPGCADPQGVRGPYATTAGDLPDSERLHGPWAEVFGRTIGDVRERLVEVALPTNGGPPVTVVVHEVVAPALDAVIATLEDHAADGRTYEIRPERVSSYRAATVPPKRYLSFHAVGSAIDINTDTNPYRADNVLVTDMPAWFVDAWRDAGWCWGGDWQTIKDPMHFSWKGPLHTPVAPPQPVEPESGAGTYDRTLILPTALGPAPPGSHSLVADLDRDGAPDAVRIRPWGDAVAIDIAQALYRFRGSCVPIVLPPIDPSATLLLADATGDGRPDLWEVVSGSNGTITVHVLAGDVRGRLAPKPIGIAPAAAVLAADHDRDGLADLHVVDGRRVEVWAGPTFTDRLAAASLPSIVATDWRFALADADADAIPDVLAVEPGSEARVVAVFGAAGFERGARLLTTGAVLPQGRLTAADVDGDGRPDLVALDDDGVLSATLGGDRTDVADDALTAWFVEGDTEPRTFQEGCPGSAPPAEYPHPQPAGE